MRRFWILLSTEIKALVRDPISVLGGFIAPGILMVAFGLLFGGPLSFHIAVINRDAGPWGAVLRQTAGTGLEVVVRRASVFGILLIRR